MKDDASRSNLGSVSILQLNALKKARQEQSNQAPHARVKVEVACTEPVGKLILDRFSADFESMGCLVVGDDKPDWILSVIAFSAGDIVELSIVLRRLFRSTLPGTEVENLDSDGTPRLRAGGWVYESLRFHGLFGVPRAELASFIGQMVRDFPVQREEDEIGRRNDGNHL